MDFIEKYTQLNDEQKSFVSMGLALKKHYGEIKSTFEQLFEVKIAGEALIRFHERFKQQIEEQSKIELKDINKVPVAHARIRMEFIYKGLIIASTPKAVGSFRSGPVGAEEYVIEKDVNHQAIAKYLQLAQNEEYLSKKLLLEICKLKDTMETDKPLNGFKPVEINDAINWDALITENSNGAE